MPDVALTVIGGGVVGLAIAAELAPRLSPLLLLERNARYGQETSSRNSEVIHAGIYYPSGSLKARLCVEGNRLLYELCSRHEIPHRRITKVIAAQRLEEIEELTRLYRLATTNGAPMEMLTGTQVTALEPAIPSVGGLFSPSTGIISAHGLMDYFAHAAREHGAEIQARCRVTGLERTVDGYRITVDEGGQASSFTSERVINAAGLESDTIAGFAGIDADAAGYRLHYCKGCYFSLSGPLSRSVSRLVYPVPSADTLGVHVVLDLGGRMRFGPDIEYLEDRTLDYTVSESKRHAFALSVRRLLPQVRDEDLAPDIAGIRPKLQVKGGPHRDFVIRDEADRGLPGLVNLIGIESPGLTASPAIARYVAGMLL